MSLGGFARMSFSFKEAFKRADFIFDLGELELGCLIENRREEDAVACESGAITTDGSGCQHVYLACEG